MSSDSEKPGVPSLAIEGPYATIRLNRPRHHNRVEAEDIPVLAKLLDRVEQDRARVLVLSAAGPTFCSGYDLRDLARARGRDAAPEAARDFERLVDRLEAVRVPTVCALTGNVYGGGTDLALACDFRIGHEGVEMLMPAARIGVHYYHGGLRRYVERLGLGAAKRLFLAAERIGSAEMLRIGFLDEVVPWSALTARVRALADALAANAPSAVQGMKRALNDIARGSGDAEAVSRAWLASLRSEALREGLEAHAAKRRPKFRD
jgi:enoyl-CoA hydratase/carnithine racemase